MHNCGVESKQMKQQFNDKKCDELTWPSEDTFPFDN